MNPYIDINGIDRSHQIENDFKPTLEDIKNDPEFYAELVNDLMYHWVYGTRETALMVMAKHNLRIGNEGKVMEDDISGGMRNCGDDYYEDLGPEYDSAGFTDDDRIVNGSYMVLDADLEIQDEKTFSKNKI